MKKRIFSILLTVCLLVGMLPTVAYAATTISGTITDGDYWDEIVFFAPEANISGGTFYGEVTNDSSLKGGIFYGKVTNRGVIKGGTFYGDVENNDRIQDGTFYGDVENNDWIKDGTFYGDVENNDCIEGGTFYGTISGTGSVSGVTYRRIVTFDSYGGSEVDKQDLLMGDKASEPDVPVKEGYIFEGWYKGDTKYDFTQPVNENITLTAQWEVDDEKPVITGLENGKTYCDAVEFEVSDNDGVASVKANGTELIPDNGKYTLAKGLGTVTVVATDNSGNTAEVTVTVNDGHTYGEWASNGDGTHTRRCTVDGCSAGTQTENCNDSDKDHKCDSCGIKISDHIGGTATCEAKAVCEICGEAYGEVDSSNHNLEKIPAKDATVTETGNTAHWHCKDCDKYFSDENGENEIELADTVLEKLPPEIIEGKGQSVTEGEKKDLTFRSNAAFSDFIRVELDGKTLDEKNYTVKEGSTVVNLKADYVATLSVGEHTIGIVSESGTATTTFTVNAKAVVDNDTKSPQTGDNSNLALWIALLVASVLGITGTTVYSRRKRVR